MLIALKTPLGRMIMVHNAEFALKRVACSKPSAFKVEMQDWAFILYYGFVSGKNSCLVQKYGISTIYCPPTKD